MCKPISAIMLKDRILFSNISHSHSDILKENGIKYHYINCNLPSQIEYFGMDCRKISADIYIDDKQLGGIPDDWNLIYDLVHKQIKGE